MARRVPLRSYLGPARKHTLQVIEEYLERFPIYFSWADGPSGDHAAGKAADFSFYDDGTVDNPGPIRAWVKRDLEEYTMKHRDRLGVAYFISGMTIWSRSPRSVTGVDPWQPKRYTGGTSHTHHIHISFVDNPPAYRPPNDQKDDEMSAAEVKQITDAIKGLRAEVVDLREKVDERVGGLGKRIEDMPAEVAIKVWAQELVHPNGSKSAAETYLTHGRADAWSAPATLRALRDFLVAFESQADLAEAQRDALASQIEAVDARIAQLTDEDEETPA